MFSTTPSRATSSRRDRRSVRQQRLSAMVPVRFPPDLLDEVRRRAEADDWSLSSWIRRAIEHELSNSA